MKLEVWRAALVLVYGIRAVTCSCSPRVAATLALLTMTPHSTNDSSIFKDGKMKPGIYKIQNINTETYLDIEVHKREVCCRPAKDLGEGRGLVSRYPPSVVHASDNQKWDIKQFGAGYTVQWVSLPISSGAISATICEHHRV